MRTMTMQEFAPDPNWQRRVKARRPIEPDPVFQLTRKIHRHPAIPTYAVAPSHPRVPDLSTRRSMPPDGQLTTSELAWLTVGEPTVGEPTVGEPIAVRVGRRPVVVRVAGLLALAAALSGAGFVLRDSAAGRQALSWVTLGHADVVLGSVR